MNANDGSSSFAIVNEQFLAWLDVAYGSKAHMPHSSPILQYVSNKVEIPLRVIQKPTIPVVRQILRCIYPTHTHTHTHMHTVSYMNVYHN